MVAAVGAKGSQRRAERSGGADGVRRRGRGCCGGVGHDCDQAGRTDARRLAGARAVRVVGRTAARAGHRADDGVRGGLLGGAIRRVVVPAVHQGG